MNKIEIVESLSSLYALKDFEEEAIMEVVAEFRELKEKATAKKPMEAVVAELENASYQTDSTFDEDGYCNDDSEEVVELHTAISIVRGKE